MRRQQTEPLAGLTAVITGAGSGIGRALAHRLSRQGCPVALADVDAAGLAETARSITTPTLTRHLDVRDGADVSAFADEVGQWSPTRIGAVFNNAGVAVQASVAEGDPGDDQWLWDINFHGVVNGTRAFLPLLLAQRSGAIVNTSSVYGLLAVPFHSAYCASKFAVRGYTESLRHELDGTGVRAVTVHPGGVRTQIAERARVRSDPEGRGRSAEQIAAEFNAATMTTPERAAQVILGGLEKGRPRILVGLDAKMVDLAVRLAPSRALSLLALVEPKPSTESAVAAP